MQELIFDISQNIRTKHLFMQTKHFMSVLSSRVIKHRTFNTRFDQGFKNKQFHKCYVKRQDWK